MSVHRSASLNGSLIHPGLCVRFAEASCATLLMRVGCVSIEVVRRMCWALLRWLGMGDLNRLLIGFARDAGAVASASRSGLGGLLLEYAAFDAIQVGRASTKPSPNQA
jgi:hypothetical protein